MNQQTLFPINNRCQITVENGMLVLATPYDHALVESVKQLPYTERRYDANRRVWFVDPKHGWVLVDWISKYMGETVNLPQITQYKEEAVTRLLEVRYIGACKQRDDGSSMAYGLVGKDWSVILPESVLRAWFDSEDYSEPTQAQTLYQVLGIKKSSSVDELKTAYRRMVKQWHPDVCREQNAQEVFIRIQEAYSLLSDNNKRARYDAGLALQTAFDKQQENTNKMKKAFESISTYRSPLRCGLILMEGIEKLGRLEVSKILAWEDVVVNGKTLVVSWPMGAKEPVEMWS